MNHTQERNPKVKVIIQSNIYANSIKKKRDKIKIKIKKGRKVQTLVLVEESVVDLETMACD